MCKFIYNKSGQVSYRLWALKERNSACKEVQEIICHVAEAETEAEAKLALLAAVLSHTRPAFFPPSLPLPFCCLLSCNKWHFY